MSPSVVLLSASMLLAASRYRERSRIRGSAGSPALFGMVYLVTAGVCLVLGLGIAARGGEGIRA